MKALTETCPNCGAVRITYKGKQYGSWNHQADHYGRRTERICTHVGGTNNG